MCDSSELPDDFVSVVKGIDYKSPVTKINVAVNKLPNFIANPNSEEGKVMPHHKCTIHLNCESTSMLDRAYLDAVSNNEPSRFRSCTMQFYAS